MGSRMHGKGALRRAVAWVVAGCGAVAATCGGVDDVRAEVVTVLLEGQAAPGLPGTVAGQLEFLTINDSGRVAVNGLLLNGTGGVTAANDGVGWTGTPGALSVIAREGAAAPGLAGITFETIPSWRDITDTGHVAFRADLAGAGVTAANNSSAWLQPPAGASQLAAREGGAAPGLTGVTFSAGFFSVLSAGDVVGLNSALAGTGVTTANDSSIWVGPPGALQLIAREGSQVPGLPVGSLYGQFNSIEGINKAGHVIFETSMTGPNITVDNERAIFVGGPNNNVAVAAREGDPAPGLPAGVVFDASHLVLGVNDVGQVAFRADLRGTGVDNTNDSAFYVGVPGALGLVTRRGSQAPGVPAGGVFQMTGTTLGPFNNIGQIAFTTNLRHGSGGVHAGNDFGHWVGGPGNLRLMLREGDPFAAIPGTVLNGVGTFALNDVGQEAFSSSLVVGPGGVTASDDDVLWLGDATGDGIVVARAGSVLAGRTVVDFDRLSINNLGQIGFRAEFTDGAHGMFYFTPELHFRRTSSGTWDDRNNWSVSTRPGSVHRVFIDPDATLSVTGPASDLLVRSLQVGGGTGIATLRLQQGAVLSVAESPVTIAANGVLMGDGVISAPVVNNGTISFPTNLTVTGTLSNNGVITGSGRINAVISNAAAGQVRVNDGSRLVVAHATGTSVNSGRFDLLSGELEWDGLLSNQGQIGVVDGTLRAGRLLTNAAAGQILARDARLFFDAGLSNSGIVGFSFGASDLWGTVTNSSGGKVIVSGNAQVTFLSVFTNQAGGELRISPGTSAVFFAPVNNNGTITGGGGKFFELGGSNLGPLATAGSTSVAAPASLTATHIREASLTVSGRVTISPNGTTLGTSRLGALNILDGGVVDLINNDLVIDEGNLAQVTSYLSSGKLTSSSATAITTLGVMLNGTRFTTFSGQAVDPTDVLVKYTYFGDANLDGRVSIADYLATDRGFARNLTGWANGDFNYSGVIDAADFFLIDQAFINQGAVLAPALLVEPTPVPEPSAILMLVLAAPLLRRRR